MQHRPLGPVSSPLALAVALALVVASGCRSADATENAPPLVRQSLVAQRAAGKVVVTLDDAPFATVVLDGDPKPYVYPLYGPGGVPMTRSYPLEEARPDEQSDHPHHVSMWFAHGDVNGFDFWHGSGRGERQVLGDSSVAGDGASATVTAAYTWETEEGPLLVETRTLRFHGTDEARVIDVDLTLRPASLPVTFGDTKEGTFALRLHPALRLKGPAATARIRNANGQSDGECWGKQAAWVDYSGTVEGREVGVTILDHPSNPRHPTWWHARDYGLFAANPFGAHDFSGAPEGAGDLELHTLGKLRLRYRVLLHAGAPSDAELHAALAAYTRE